MKFTGILLSGLLLAILCVSCAQKKLVRVQITFVQSYCGGARPSAEMLEEAQKAKPYANKTLIIVSNKRKVDSVKTNSEGSFNINLKAGTYKLFEAWRYYKKAPQGMLIDDFDKDCLKSEWEKEVKEIFVTKKEVKVTDKNVIVEVCPWKVACILESRRPPANE